MGNTLQTDLKKKTQQETNLLYVPAQTAGQANAGSANLAQASPAAQATAKTAGAAGPSLEGVSDWTQQRLGQYGQQYAPSQTVNEAKSYLNSVIADRPGEYSSKYAADIASLYDQIMNRPKFTYDVNKDPLFQQYKNQYTVQGQRAMQDTLGQAAALSGGYGNSWGATAGYQAYQYYLQQLNDRVPELEQRAFDRYTAEGNEMRDNMNLATTLDSIDYNRYRDTVADWQADRDFANQMYAQEKSWDMNDWNSLRSYYTQLASLENSSYWTGENLKENARQFDLELAENQRQADMLEAYRRDSLAEQARQFDAGLAEDIRQADMSDKLQRDKLAEEARRFDADLAEKIRQFDTTTAYNERAWQHGLEREAVEDARYADETAYNRERDAKQDEYNQMVWEHGLEREAVEDARYADETAYNRSQDEIANALKQAAFDEGVRQFDLGYDLDKAQFDLTYQKYLDQLAQLAGTGTGGGGGNGGNGGSDTTANTTPEEKAAANSAAAKEAPSLQELMVNYAQNKVGVTGETLTETLKKDVESQKGDMVTLPVASVNASGTLNQGPLAERTPAMPREQAEDLIDELEELNKKNKTTSAKKTTSKTSLATQTNKSSQLNQWLNTTKK